MLGDFLAQSGGAAAVDVGPLIRILNLLLKFRVLVQVKAAAMGEQVMPICEEMLAMLQGRSGRMPFFSAMSQMMGMSV